MEVNEDVSKELNEKEIEKMENETLTQNELEIDEEIDETEFCVCIECGEIIPIEDSYELPNGDKICRSCKEDKYVECYECGDLILKDDAFYANDVGEYFCESCSRDCLSYCEHCDENIYYKDGMELVNTRHGAQCWCESCIENDSFYCNGYNEYYSDYYNQYEVNGNTYCGDYCEDNFEWCHRCESYVDRDDYNYNQNCCVNCQSDESEYIRGYHDRPYLQFFGLKERLEKDKRYNEDTQASIGIELEIDREDEDIDACNNVCEYIINNTKYNEIYFNEDGSLDYGFEIITQPHTIEEFYKINWSGILAKCIEEGFKSHDIDTCGLHMHISRDFFGKTINKQSTAIAKLISFYDANYNEIIKVARRSYDKAIRWSNRHDIDNSTNPQKLAYALAKGKEYSRRYKAVNLTNKNTIEFRIMRGTLKYENFMACIDFLYTIAKNSRTIKWKDLYRIDLWFKGMKKETIEYIKSRNAFNNYFENNNTINLVNNINTNDNSTFAISQ